MQIPKLPRGIYLLFLLNAQSREPIKGRLVLEKLVFLLTQEVLSKPGRRITDQSYSFRAYKFGPFTEEIFDDLETMINYDMIDSNEDRSEYTITDKGVLLINKLNKSEILPTKLLLEIEDIKKKYNSMKVKDLLYYVYKNYEDYTHESEIRNKVLGI